MSPPVLNWPGHRILVSLGRDERLPQRRKDGIRVATGSLQTMTHLWPLSLLLFALLSPGSARAATGVDAARTAAQARRQELNSLRSRQMELRRQLGELGGRIDALKSRSKAATLLGGELQTALQQSQSLSAQLTGLAQQVSSTEAAAHQDDLGLLEALSAQLTSLRSELDRSRERDARRRLLADLRKLRAEREQLRARLPAASLPGLPSSGPATGSEDDPEDLLEQADATRDSEDKVRRELKSLEGRIVEAREERELDRRMTEFLGDEALLDEGDRRLRAKTEVLSTASAPDKSLAATPGEPSAGPPQDRAPSPAPASVEVTRVPSSSADLGSLGSSGLRAPGAAASGDLATLESQQARLRSLAEQLKQRADALEARARQLH